MDQWLPSRHLRFFRLFQCGYLNVVTDNTFKKFISSTWGFDGSSSVKYIKLFLNPSGTLHL